MTVTAVALLGALGASPAPVHATPTWTVEPAAAPAGALLRLASDAGSRCEWWMPDPDGGEMHRYDGTTVQVTLRDPNEHRLGVLPVRAGGAWSGRLRVPAGTAPGRYGLWVRCIVDHPDLDGRRSFDFDPHPFRVTAPAPGPTTTTAPPPKTGPPPTVPPPTVPPTLPSPPVDVGPPPATLVAGPPAVRTSTTVRAAARTTAPGTARRPATLPNTGSDLRLALVGLAALTLGAVALASGRRTVRAAGPRHRGVPRRAGTEADGPDLRG